MGKLVDSIKKVFRIVLTLVIIGGLFYLAHYMMNLKIEIAGIIAIIVGLLFYAIMSNYESPDKVKQVFRFLFSAGGAILIGWFGQNMGYILEYYVGMAVITFIVLFVLLNKGKNAGDKG